MADEGRGASSWWRRVRKWGKRRVTCGRRRDSDVTPEDLNQVNPGDSNHVVPGRPEDSNHVNPGDTNHVVPGRPEDSNHINPGDTNHVVPGRPEDSNHINPGDSNHVKPGDTNHVAHGRPEDSNHVNPGDTNHVVSGIPEDSNHVNPGDTNHVNPGDTSRGGTGEATNQPENNAASASLGEDTYRIVKRGFALIFNHHKFDDDNARERTGTLKDEARLNSILQQHDFEIEIIRDGTRDQVLDTVDTFSRTDHCTRYDCLLVLVTTHGMAGGILHARDNKSYLVQDIWSPFLVNKELEYLPKIFIFQACRGNSVDRGRHVAVSRSPSANTSFNSVHRRTNSDVASEQFSVSDSEKTRSGVQFAELSSTVFNEVHPNYPNLLVVYSTVRDFCSWRTECGTFYVQNLCSVLEESRGDLDLVKLLTRVNNRVAREKTRHNQQYRQAPSLTSSVTHKIFLRRKGFLPS